MQKAVDLLRAVTDAFPPGKGQYHGLTLRDDGPGLVLTIMRGMVYQPIMLDSEDLEREASDTLAEIQKIMPKDVQ